MAERTYRILVAKDRRGIFALAGEEWSVLENSIKEFRNLDSDDDLHFEDVGAITITGTGFVALAFK